MLSIYFISNIKQTIMATPRFYCDPKFSDKLALGAQVKLSENATIHATRVLRMGVGEAAILFNGDGHDYRCEFIHVTKNEVIGKIISAQLVEKESPLNIWLVQAISSGDRMDYTLQKAVEMGVSCIQPIMSERSVVKLNPERAQKRTEHWQNVVNSACEQCGRAVVPKVANPMTLSQWLGTKPQATTKITLSPQAQFSFKTIPNPSQDICILVGAEGGLTQGEIDLATQEGFIPIKMGPRILRTETAPVAAIAAMQTLWGDFCV
jgi:16S rRNA (uracil1498-N3)-methyltransferase